MTSEWMKVMLEEIERKKLEAEQSRRETERRRTECEEAVNREDARPVRTLPAAR